jgi:hypothetical protein
VIQERQYIKDSLYDWAAAVVAEEGRTDPVIWDHDDGPRPVAPFISLEFTGGGTPGFPNYGKVVLKKKPDGTPDGKDDGKQLIRQFVRKALTMYAFGEGAIDLLETIKASIYREQYMAMLSRKGLVIPNALDVTESPAVRGTDTENCAFFEFWITYIRVIEDVPGWIGSVDISSDNLLGDITITTEEANG